MIGRRYGPTLLNLVTAAAAIAAVIIGGMRVRNAFFRPATAEAALPRTKTVPEWKEAGSAGARIGPAEVPVTIVAFLDFQCGLCRVAAGDLHDLRRWYRDRIAVVYRHFPVTTHGFAAAVAAECARRQDAFSPFHDELFARADSVGTKTWVRFALDAGIRDTTRFANCLNDPTAAAVVRADSTLGATLGVEGTPTFLINDRFVPGNQGFSRLNEYVKQALAERAR